ncbi:hypothetical protein [Streptomyces litmocidini]|uniref:hypothetical protein n=1 Tax=Streptomyces litmocidini TaxID=67318 RepID=UPI0036FEC2FF
MDALQGLAVSRLGAGPFPGFAVQAPPVRELERPAFRQEAAMGADRLDEPSSPGAYLGRIGGPEGSGAVDHR